MKCVNNVFLISCVVIKSHNYMIKDDVHNYLFWLTNKILNYIALNVLCNKSDMN